MGSRSRIARLEQQLAPVQAALTPLGDWDAAVLADVNGTATLAQYEMLYLRQARDDALGLVPIMVTIKRLGISGVHGFLQSMLACAFPPHEALDPDIGNHVRNETRDYRDTATTVITAEHRRIGRLEGGRPPEEWRRAGAVAYLLFGDSRASGLRDEIWTKDVDGEWVLDPKVCEAGRTRFKITDRPGPQYDSTYGGLATLLCMAGVKDHVMYGPAEVSFADLVNAAIDFATTADGPPEWSKQVRTGQRQVR